MERSDDILRMLKINYAASQDDVQEFSWMPILKIFTFLKEEEAKQMAIQYKGSIAVYGDWERQS